MVLLLQLPLCVFNLTRCLFMEWRAQISGCYQNASAIIGSICWKSWKCKKTSYMIKSISLWRWDTLQYKNVSCIKSCLQLFTCLHTWLFLEQGGKKSMIIFDSFWDSEMTKWHFPPFLCLAIWIMQKTSLQKFTWPSAKTGTWNWSKFFWRREF